jgi:hypothetical protein
MNIKEIKKLKITRDDCWPEKKLGFIEFFVEKLRYYLLWQAQNP